MPKSNHLPIPAVSIELGGSTYELAFTFGALADAKRLLSEQGVEVNLLQCILWNRLDFDTLAPMLWAAIRARHPKVKYEEIAEAIDLDNADRAYVAILNAYAASKTAIKAKEKNESADPQ